MTKKICFIMDPLAAINVKKDTTYALMREAQHRNWEIYVLEAQQLFLKKHDVNAFATRVKIIKEKPYFNLIDPLPHSYSLQHFDYIFMRKDPPFDATYLYATYLLELAQAKGCVIVNDPRSIRDTNEKLSTAWFPELAPATIVTSQKKLIHDFLQQYKKIIIKPLSNMGGYGVFLITQNDPNINVVIELLSFNQTFPVMVQQFIPEIAQGDKRILMLNGEPIPYALSRMPPNGEIRANLASGGNGIGSKLTASDLKICQQVGPMLKAKGLFFVGLDVIGDYLTEINVTSPTCVQEIERAFEVNVSSLVLDGLDHFVRGQA